MNRIAQVVALRQPPLPRQLLVSNIRAQVCKGDAAKARADKQQKKSEIYYVAAGRYLAELKAHYAKSWADWEEILKTEVKLSTGRASELMQLADGRKDLQQVRDEKAQSVRHSRANSSSLQRRCSEEPPRQTAREMMNEAMVRVRARAMIVDFLNKDIREEAVKLIHRGEYQDRFDLFRDGIADLYQQLMRVGR